MRNLLNLIIFSLITILFSIVQCSGSYYGIKGSSTYTRQEAIDRLTTIQIVWYINCQEKESATELLIKTSLTNPRRILDGAFYSKKDVNECEKAILFTPCTENLPRCNLAPKEILRGKFLEGGI